MQINRSGNAATAPSIYPPKDYWAEIEVMNTLVSFANYDPNTGTLWGISGANIVKSIDNGDTWQVSGTKTCAAGYTVAELFITSTGALLALAKNSPFTNGKIFRSSDGGLNWVEVYDWITPSYVLAKGWCEHPNYDGNGNAAIYVGEYTAETVADGVRLLRSIDDGATFSVIDTQVHLGSGIRHWHFIVYDPWDNCLWLGSGDLPANDKLFKITDGITLTYVNGGTYDWKFVTVVPEKGCLYCFSDRTDVYTGVPVYKYLKRENKLKILGYTGSCSWYGAMVDTYRIPFFITQANATTSQNSYVQGYIWDEYVREVVRIPIAVGQATVHTYQVCSVNDYVFIQIASTVLNLTTTAFIRLKIKPIRANSLGVS